MIVEKHGYCTTYLFFDDRHFSVAALFAAIQLMRCRWMKLLASGRALNVRISAFPLIAGMIALLISTAFVPAAVTAQTLRIDLLRMSEMLDVRYYITEKGEVPVRYFLLGGLSFYPNPLESEFDLRNEIIEYDEGMGLMYRFRVPRQYYFSRKEERRDVFYYYAPRDLSVPSLSITIERVDDRLAEIRRQSTKSVWIEDIRYNLSKERVERAGKGLLSVDIPISLPKPIERIIGKGEETNLTVQGSERIQISGTSEWCANCPYTEGRPRQDKFPDLDMEQQLNVSLHGNIGEKINVEIQHSSMGQGSQSTNRVRLNYRGFDDDIIKLIEMGDTDLSLSGAQLVSYSQAAKGLFGVKAIAQTGPLDVTVIASKEEGENASGSFSTQGGQISSVAIPDYDFVQRQFFYFENPGFDFMSPRGGFRTIYPVIGADDDIEVFISLTKIEREQPQNIVVYSINAYPDESNDGLADDIQGGVKPWWGLFKRLRKLDGDYTFLRDYGVEGETQYVAIELARPLDDEQALVIRYKARGGDQEFLVGNYEHDPVSSTDTLIAELICPPKDDAADPAYYPVWPMMLRNVYSLGQSPIDPRTLIVRIEDLTNRAIKYIHPQSGINYLRIFGLDRVNNSTGLKGKDDIIDDLPGIVDPERGYLMFPWYEPFNPPEAIARTFLDDTADAREKNFDYRNLARDSAVYNSELNEIVKRDNHHYNIVVEASSGQQRTFQLPAFEIIEGSEVVTVDGIKLQRGTDYDIDYMNGTVTLKGSGVAQMNPDSRVNIDFQQKPLVGGGKKSLLGVGANLNLSPNFRISGTFLYSSMGAPKYTPRLGEEPSRVMATDVNGTFVFYPTWMTSLANLLPRVDTNTQSNLNLSGEVALSLPNPNVMGKAIVDDMEGVEESDAVSLTRMAWYQSSPVMEQGAPRYPSEGLEFAWYNVPSEREMDKNPLAEYITSRRDLNPRLELRENSNVNALIMNAINPGPGQWFGIMTGFPGGLDLTSAQYLEIWVNDFQSDPAKRGGTVHIDFGKIDEDFFKPDQNKFDDEDKPPIGWTIQEDIGFDNDDRCEYTKSFESTIDWIPSKRLYRGINCRKGNSIHDTEDLNDNGYLDDTNAYYTLAFNLADSATIDVRRDFPTADLGNKAWRKYRIDLSDVTSVLAAPNLNAVKHMRIWIENPDSLISQGDARMLQIAELQFVGNRWEINGTRRLDGTILPPGSVPLGQKLTVGAINNKDDPSHYRPPYQVQQEEGIENKEQSLSLRFVQFADSTSFRIVKRFAGQGQNYGQYRDVQFFVYPDYGIDDLYFYLQIAYDSMNYYEIEVPLKQSGWIRAVVNFSDLTNLKISAERDTVSREIRDALEPSRSYTARLRGNPTLLDVRYLFAGLRNRGTSTIPEGEVWFNDIRLGGVRRDIDHATRMSFSADFANILQVMGGWQRTGPDFRSLQQSRGSGVTNDNLNLNAKTEISYFLPTVGFNLPVNVHYNTSNSLPKYVPQSDVEIADAEVRDSLKSVNTSLGYNVSLSRRGSTNFMMRNLFDNLKLGYSYAKRGVSTPTSRDTSWSMSGSLNYQVQFRKTRQLGLFRGSKWRYWLSNLSYESSASREVRRAYARNDSVFVRRPSYYAGTWTNAFSTLYEPFESIKIDFRANERRDLALGREIYDIPIGAQTNFNHSVGLNYQPSRQIFILSEFNPRFEFKSNYTEDLRPTIRQTRKIVYDTLYAGTDSMRVDRITITDPVGTRNVVGQRDMNFTFSVDVGKYILRFGQIMHFAEKSEAPVPRGRVVSGSRPVPRGAEDLQKMLEERRSSKAGESTPKPEGAIALEDTIPSPGAGPGQLQTPAREEPPGQAQPGTLGEIAVRRPPTWVGREAPGKTPAVPARGDSTGAARADTAGARADTAAARRQIALLPIKKLVTLLGKIEPVDANVRMSHQSNYQRIYDRASLLYQLGISDAAGVPGKTSEEENTPETATDNFGIDMRSKVGLTQNLVLDFNGSFDQMSSETKGLNSQTTRTVWPSVNLDWRGMDKYRLLNRYIRGSDVKVGFERRKNKNRGREENAYKLTPLLSLDWKNSLSTTMSVTYSKSTTIESNQELWSKSWSVSMDLRYNIEGSRGIGLPIPFLNRKKISFKSTLTTNLGISYASASTYNQPAAGTLGVSPNVSYRFSNNVTGALAINYRRSSGGQLGQVRQSIQVSMSAEFKF
jgi:hypothetical protein